jgi:hypothetical protein
LVDGAIESVTLIVAAARRLEPSPRCHGKALGHGAHRRALTDAGVSMNARLTTEEVGLLKELMAAGNKGRIVNRPTPPLGLVRLVNRGYVVAHRVSVGTVYTITVAGKHALVQHQG